ncbi:MAG: acylphosphatase [Nanoarchaeota archaeon]|nr:acylphosphatase [Nanoarchaeota archaeon]
MKRFHIFVSGRVQGVFFRANAVNVAKTLGIKGWVRNRKDGRVEIVAEGEDEKLKEFIKWVKKGPILAKVTKVEIKEETPAGEFKEFERRETV